MIWSVAGLRYPVGGTDGGGLQVGEIGGHTGPTDCGGVLGSLASGVGGADGGGLQVGEIGRHTGPTDCGGVLGSFRMEGRVDISSKEGKGLGGFLPPLHLVP